MGFFDSNDSDEEENDSDDDEQDFRVGTDETAGFRPVDQAGERSTMTRAIDREAGVVIYHNAGSFSTEGIGLAAVPLQHTNLDIDNQNVNHSPEDSE